MRKENIRVGDIIHFRDGVKKIIFNKTELQDLLNHIDENLKHCYKQNDYRNERYDIVKITRPTAYTKIYDRKEDILDAKEKEYLSNVIKPFRNRIEYIKKNALLGEKKETIIINYIDICYPNEIYFPSFEKGTMYKNMESNKEYTLTELGI